MLAALSGALCICVMLTEDAGMSSVFTVAAADAKIAAGASASCKATKI